ncbi:MAG TPA: protein phosphatase 2C domain-containing protein [Gemmatimonadaceae bacterium]
MKVAEMFTTNAHQSQRVRDDEIDLFGLTHPGKKRAENEDHFLACTVHPEVIVHATSLPNVERLPLRGEWRATIALVADGVGGNADGGEASRIATETIMRYVSSSLQSYHDAGSMEEDVFLESLRGAVMEAHHAVRTEAKQRGGPRPMATTLTLGIVVWPWLYVVQLGDSRAYYYWEGKLTQVTRDQTVAQELVDQGVLPRERLASSPYRHVLSRAVGGEAEEAIPEVTRVRIDRFGSVLLFCSDGLTKHVSDEEIARKITDNPRAEDVCKSLLDLALDRGGSDNITIVVVRRRIVTPAAAAPAVG